MTDAPVTQNKIKSLPHFLLALALSILGFPGLGHFYLKYKKTGIILSVLTTILFIVLVVHFEIQMFDQIKKIKGMYLSKDLVQGVVQETLVSSSTLYTWLSYGLGLLWIIGVVDLVMLKLRDGKKEFTLPKE